MLDERWPTDAAEMSVGLRSLLKKECGPETVRAAEARSDGRDLALEERLESFGLWDLPNDPAILAVAAWEIGRALAPVPYPECAGTAAVLGLRETSNGLEGPVPVPPTRSVVRIGHGDLVVTAVRGSARRSAAGDLLAENVSAMSSDERVGAHEDGDRMERLGRLLHSARILGASERLFEIGVDYAKRRSQFGKPIGSFQAVAHRLADAAIAREGATQLLRKAAWVAATEQGGDGSPSRAFAAMTWAKSVDAGRFVAAAVHQAMGGYGFTVEEDAQLFSRRIRSWSMRLPAPGPELSALARRLLDPAQRDEVRYLWQHEVGLPVPRWAAEADEGSRG